MDGDSGPTALPFKIQRGVWGPFGRVSGLMRLEGEALVLEFEVNSVLPWVRKKLRELRIPYRDIVLADFDFLDRFVVRTARTLSLAELPTRDKGEVTFELSNVRWDTLSKKAAKKLAATLNHRISEQS